MHAHAITINICFWGSCTVATVTVIIATIRDNTKRAIEQVYVCLDCWVG